MVRLSIIVPVYNVEKYLKRCIFSLLHQDIDKTEYEIIVINDGSIDSSLSIAKALAREYENIKVINQANQGLSGARNVGLRNSSGKYIWFVDSDDYIEDNCVKQMLDEIDGFGADVYAFLLDVKKKKPGYCTVGKQPLVLNQVMTGKDAFVNGFIPGSVCSFLFSRHYLELGEFQFTLGLVHEDIEFTTYTVALSKKVVFTKHKPYIYDFNPTSLSKSKLPNIYKKNLLDNIVLSSNLKKFSSFLKDKDLALCIDKCANSIILGLLFSVVKEKDRHVLLPEILELAKESGLYPINKPFLTWKSTVLSEILNKEWFLRWVC